MLLPLGVVSHSLTNQHTFLNDKLFDDSINLYKVIMIIIILKLIYEYVFCVELEELSGKKSLFPSQFFKG